MPRRNIMNRRNPLFTPEEIVRIEAKIKGAERITSAEIKVVIVKNCWVSLKRKAHKIFGKYQLDMTSERNAVLILLVSKSKEFLIYGDEGIHEKVGQLYWEDVRDAMMEKFRHGQLSEGLCLGVHMLGEKLSSIFPVEEDDRDELSNNVIFEN